MTVFMSPGLVSRDGGRVGGPMTLHEPFLGDFCWDVQIRKNGVNIKIKNYSRINLLKP